MLSGCSASSAKGRCRLPRNLPNIATIHGLEEAGATRALVMELVEGPTLADRIAQDAIPLAEAFPIAKQIAEALD